MEGGALQSGRDSSGTVRMVVPVHTRVLLPMCFQNVDFFCLFCVRFYERSRGVHHMFCVCKKKFQECFLLSICLFWDTR